MSSRSRGARDNASGRIWRWNLGGQDLVIQVAMSDPNPNESSAGEKKQGDIDRVDAVLVLGLVRPIKRETAESKSKIETLVVPTLARGRKLDHSNWRLVHRTAALPNMLNIGVIAAASADKSTFGMALEWADKSSITSPLFGSGERPPKLHLRAVDERSQDLASAARVLLGDLAQNVSWWKPPARGSRSINYLPKQFRGGRVPKVSFAAAQEALGAQERAPVVFTAKRFKTCIVAALRLAHDPALEVRHRLWIRWESALSRSYDLHQIACEAGAHIDGESPTDAVRRLSHWLEDQPPSLVVIEGPLFSVDETESLDRLLDRLTPRHNVVVLTLGDYSHPSERRIDLFFAQRVKDSENPRSAADDSPSAFVSPETVLNQEHLALIKQGADAISEWRTANPSVQLDLRSADLSAANLSAADLSAANLSAANLSAANLSAANLSAANLSAANLSAANLSAANLSAANLSAADLSAADLSAANLSAANLTAADLSGARFGGTNLGALDVSVAIGLSTVIHVSPSTIGVDTLTISKGRIPKEFLGGCGLEPWQVLEAKLYDPEMNSAQLADLQAEVFSLRTQGPMFLGGIFVSYSHEDRSFVEKLEERLKKEGARIWRDVKDAEAGPLSSQIAKQIRVQDVVLLVLSENSVHDDWVENELDMALRRERKEGRNLICPVAIDDSWKDQMHVNFKTLARKKVIIDFSKWKTKAFEREFERLVMGLKKHFPPKQS